MLITNRNKAQLFIVIAAASKSVIQKYRGNESNIKCLLTCHYRLEYGMLIMFRIDTDKFCGMNIEKETCLTLFHIDY